MGTGTITFQLHGKQCTAYVSNAQSKQAMMELASDLHSTSFTLAGIPRVTYCEGEEVALPESGADADVGLFANVLLRRTSDGKLYGLLIHAPHMNLFDAIQNEGYRVKQGEGVAIASMYSDCAGEEFTFQEGFLQGATNLGNLAP